MKVVALVSGGKDSCYAMQRCIDYGHEIVALANLLPVDDAVDELDSFMFQTVGHQMVISIAQCMGLPLFRRRIQGTARLQDLRYRKTMGDEVEDLEKLLQAVTKKFPEVGAVSSGAIASDYQRLRVESVCSGLGLVSLAYLWKQDQALLLQHMIDSGIYAVLVKVASIGMDPHKHLGKDLATLQSHFTRLRSMYGSNICGEGGEYETLTLDSPLFKKEAIFWGGQAPRGGDLVSRLQRLVAKRRDLAHPHCWIALAQHARIILDEFEVTLHSPDQIAPVGVLHPTKFHLLPKSPAAKGSLDYSSLIFEVNDDTGSEEDPFRIGTNIATNELVDGRMNDKVHTCTISQQHGNFTFACWRQLDGENMNIANFGQANEVYVQYITEQKCERGVPSRCCMQVCLSESHMGGTMVEVTASSDLSKKVLHVQSISCWAPSCIGPYSQATLSGNILHMAGQLGLDPPTMTLVPGGAATEMKQALYNCEAVARAFDASLSTAAITFTIYCSESAIRTGLQHVEEKLQDFLSTVDENYEAGEERGPSLHHSETRLAVPLPLILYVLVPALPKGAQVEVEPSAFVLDFSRSYYSSDEDSSGESGCEGSSSWQTVRTEPSTTSLTRGEDQSNSHLLLSEIKKTHYLICSTCESLILPTRICRALVWIGGASGGSGVRDLTEVLKSMQLEEKDLERTLRQAIGALCEVLQRAGLCWSEVTAFRMYFDAKAIAVADLRGAMKEVRDNSLLNTTDVGKMIPDATFVPVSRVGRTSAMQELVAIDLTAVSAKQL